MQAESFNSVPTPQAEVVQPQVVLSTTEKVAKKPSHLKALLMVALCELLIAGGVFAYFWRDNMALTEAEEAAQTISDLQAQVEELQSTINQYESSLEVAE